MHILIVEDDRPIAENLYDFLAARGHQCDHAGSLGAARLLLARAGTPDAPPAYDALILDRSLPDGDGLTLARQLRSDGVTTALLVLTARDALDDKLAGFAAGADDYLVKPFALQEVEARLLALARRAPARRDLGARVGNVRYDGSAQTVHVDERPCHLPPKALRLAALLLAHPNRVFSRQELEIAVWGSEQESSESLRTLLYTLRRALGAQATVEIATVHGVGVKLVPR